MNVVSAMVEGAELRLRQPVPSLRCHLGCFWSMTTTPATRLRTLPDACATLTVETEGGTPPRCFLAGPRLTPAERIPGAGQTLFGVRLRPGVAFALTGVPIHTLVERRPPLASLLPTAGRQLDRLLARARTADEGLDVLEAFLLRRLAGAQVDARVQRALDLIAGSGGQVRVAQLPRDCRVSSRHLRRLLHVWVGFSPKRLATVSRFQALLQRLETSPGGSSADAAAELGYFDQSHLTHDVSTFAGAGPRHLARHRVADFSKTRCG
ncbi:MAG TPA: helix-turn-helix domain-containing protein [Thermoanaerobaculia bacterium]|nr:helix-turn-helix domain-containing protein [Thermoanaerobaculia bacterium]